MELFGNKVVFLDINKDTEKVLEYIRGDELEENLDYILDNFNGEIAVVQNPKTFVGYVLVWKTEKDKGFIQPLWIFDKFRRKGIGTRLLSDAINKYGAIDLTVDVDNENAISLYKKMGFVIKQTINEDDANNPTQHWMILEK